MPKGSFICCYAGNLLTEENANEAGRDLGDEYFAELDYIEVVENLKEGYESDVVLSESSGAEDEDFDVDAEASRMEHDDSEYLPFHLVRFIYTIFFNYSIFNNLLF